MTRAWWLGSVLAVATGCELAEVTIPPGEPVVLVQAVMRPDRPQQWVLLEQSLIGVVPVQSTPGDIPRDRPQIPLVGATVTLETGAGPGDPCGDPVRFTSVPQDPLLREVDGLYWAPRGCPAMVSGQLLRLRVETPNGDVVTGETVVAGVDAMNLFHRGDTLDIGGAVLTFDRDVDTLGVEIAPTAGRALQVDVRRQQTDGSTRRVTSLFVDSTIVNLPGDLVDLFGRGTGEDVFRPGRIYELSIAYGDQNYFDFVRSANGPFTGRGFVNHLEGGLGVFGSAVASSQTVRVISQQDDAREGGYNLRGFVGGAAVNVDLDLFLHRAGVRDSVDLSAFTTGTWVNGPLDNSADGWFAGDTLRITVEQVITETDAGITLPIGVQRFHIEGVASSDTFPVTVIDDGLGRVLGVLTVIR